MEMIGVFLIGFGQVSSLDELGAFLKHVTGREPSQEMIRGARARYERIGGSSPLLKITRKQAKKLKVLLEISGISANIYIGMRHSPPTIHEAVVEAKKHQIKQAVVITLAPQYSEMSVGAYLKLFDQALEDNGNPFPVKKVRSYGAHPIFIEAVAANLKDAMEREPAMNPASTPVIFSAHSLPAKIIEKGDPYLDELKQGMTGVSERLKIGNARLAFQSRGGGPGEWLGPSIEEVIEDFKREGKAQVVVSPLGFVSDHVETLYDIDVAAKLKAKELGLEFRRAASLNDSPGFIKLLAALVKENIA